MRALEIDNATASIRRPRLQGGQALFGTNGPHGGSLMAQSSTVDAHARPRHGRLGAERRRHRQPQRHDDDRQSLIDSNTATQGGGDGGGIINFGGDLGAPASLTISNSTIAFNTARLAGGLISYGNTRTRSDHHGRDDRPEPRRRPAAPAACRSASGTWSAKPR